MAFFPVNNFYASDDAYHAWWTLFGLFILWWIINFLSSLFGNLFRDPLGRRTFGFRQRNTAIAPAAVPAVPGDGYVGGAPGVVAGAPAVGAPVASVGLHDSRLNRSASALRDLFLSALAIVVLNYFTNRITRVFNIIFWVTLFLGLLWTVSVFVSRRFGNLLLLLVIPGFIFLFLYGLVHHTILPV